MIKVCDCLTGMGKSSAAIAFMNEHPEDKFIYISVYTDEAERIVKACPALRFKEPSDKRKETNYSKSRDTAVMLSNGENVASTHQCFKFYTKDVLEDIANKGYTLIIDENINVLEECREITQGDLEALCDAGYVEIVDNEYKLTDKQYTGRWGREFMRMLQSRTLIVARNGKSEAYFYWAIPEDLLKAFKDVYILTYMFEGTDMSYYLNMCNIPYENIGVMHDDTGYHFDENTATDLTMLASLKDKIHICDNAKRNSVGDDYFALSMSWFGRPGSDVDGLKKQLYNWFNNDNRGAGKDKRLWANMGDSHGKLRTAGVWNNNLVFNHRATNNYSDKTVLAYPVNVFVNVDKKNYYNSKGLEFSEDQFALSTMIQWIWRSAIRNGKDIHVYIPSRRMRELFKGWLSGNSDAGSSGAA